MFRSNSNLSLPDGITISSTLVEIEWLYKPITLPLTDGHVVLSAAEAKARAAEPVYHGHLLMLAFACESGVISVSDNDVYFEHVLGTVQHLIDVERGGFSNDALKHPYARDQIIAPWAELHRKSKTALPQERTLSDTSSSSLVLLATPETGELATSEHVSQGKNYEFDELGVDFYPGVTGREIIHCENLCVRAIKGAHFGIGDILNQWPTRYGEKFEKAVQIFGLAIPTLKELKRIAKRLPKHLRPHHLSFYKIAVIVNRPGYPRDIDTEEGRRLQAIWLAETQYLFEKAVAGQMTRLQIDSMLDALELEKECGESLTEPNDASDSESDENSRDPAGQPTSQGACAEVCKSEVDMAIDAAVMSVSENGQIFGFTFAEIAKTAGNGVSKAAIKRWVERNTEAERIQVIGHQTYTCVTRSWIESLKHDAQEELDQVQNKLLQLNALWSRIGDKPWTPL